MQQVGADINYIPPQWSIDGVPVILLSSVRNLGIFFDTDLVLWTRCSSNSILWLRRAASTASHLPLCADGHVPDTGGCSGPIPTGLRQWRDGRSSNPPGAPPPVSTECSCTTDLRRFDNVTDALISVHWLRIAERIIYKIAILTYNTPGYLGPVARVADLPDRQALRTAGTSRLVVPPFKLCTISNRVFPVADPQVRNNLPEDITSAQLHSDFPPATEKLPFPSIFPPPHYLTVFC